MMQQVDPFAEVRIFRGKANQEQPEEIAPEDPFSEVRIKQAQGFPFLKEAGRHTARTASRIAETVGGIPGDVSSLIQSGIFAGLEKLVGHRASEETRQKAARERLPTSKELKQFSESATKGLTTAQGPTEKTIDEFMETAASLLGPMKFRKALGVALGAVGAKKGLETLGIGEGGQEAGKLGTMFLLSTINPKGALKYSNLQYEKARDLSKGASIEAKELERKLKSLEVSLGEGITTQKKTSVKNPIKELLEKINNDKIKISELTAAKRDVSDLIGEPETLKGSKKLLKLLAKTIDDAIKPYERLNPEFSKVYRPANEIYGAVQEGNKAYNFIKKTLGAKSVLSATLAEATLGHPEYILPTAAGAAGALGSAKVIDFFTRLKKSSELRKFYSRALLAARKEDAAALRLYEDKINELMEKD